MSPVKPRSRAEEIASAIAIIGVVVALFGTVRTGEILLALGGGADPSRLGWWRLLLSQVQPRWNEASDRVISATSHRVRALGRGNHPSSREVAFSQDFTQ